VSIINKTIDKIEDKLSITFHFTKLKSPASTIIGAIGGASPKPGNGEGCVRKGIRHKILASALLF
jgi:hypothetical protein